MPLYEYQCESCNHRFERIQKFSDPPIETCPSCGGPVKKLLSSPAIQFKGAGWYITDYAKKGAASETKAEGTAGEKKEGKTESSKPSDTPGAGTSTPPAGSSSKE